MQPQAETAGWPSIMTTWLELTYYIFAGPPSGHHSPQCRGGNMPSELHCGSSLVYGFRLYVPSCVLVYIYRTCHVCTPRDQTQVGQWFASSPPPNSMGPVPSVALGQVHALRLAESKLVLSCRCGPGPNVFLVSTTLDPLHYTGCLQHCNPPTRCFGHLATSTCAQH